MSRRPPSDRASERQSFRAAQPQSCTAAGAHACRSAALSVRRGAFTLVELMVSVAIMSILLVAIGSSILLASKAIPDATNPTSRVIASSNLANQIAAELRSATYITESSATAISFAVPDRDGDGSPELIRYAWSGTAGAPLTRSYNRAAAVEAVASVQNFSLAYTRATRTESYPGPPVWSGVGLLSNNGNTSYGDDRELTSTKWVGQRITPTLSADAVAWRITHASLVLSKGLFSSGRVYYRIYAGGEETPSSTVLQETSIGTGSIPLLYWQWFTLSFSSTTDIVAGDPAYLVVAGSSSDSGYVFHDDWTSHHQVRTNDAGGSWNYNAGDGMHHYVYGQVATAGPTRTLTRRHITGVTITLENADAIGQPLRIAAPLLNAPEVLTTFWETRFDLMPAMPDMNCDGHDDFRRRDGASINPSTLVNGVWHADSVVDTHPNHDFTQPTTIEVRFRNTSVGGNGAVFWINADWSASRCAPIYATLQRQADGTQNLTLYGKTSSSKSVVLARATNLPDDFVDLRLIIDPAATAVYMQVNGTPIMTANYFRITPGDNYRVATMFESGSQAEFDYLRIRVGGTVN